VAALAVVLERALVAAGHSPSAAGIAGAYGTAFWWSFGLSAAAIGPCIWLTLSERRAKRERRAAASDDPLGKVPLAEVAA
jgi:hypothetical protein